MATPEPPGGVLPRPAVPPTAAPVRTDAPNGVGDAPIGVRGRAPVWLVLLAVSLPMFMATLDNLVMTSALPVIQVDLGATVSELQWFMNAYTLAFAALMLAAAGAGDRWGRRRLFVLGIVLFTAGSISCALSTSSAALIGGRVVQGVGAAAILPLSLALLAGAVPPAKRALAIGVWGGVSGLGVALGPVVGGAIVDGVSWQAIFWINVPVAVVALGLIYAVLGEVRGARVGIDVIGVLLAGAGVFLGVWGIVHGNDDGWSSAGVVAPLLAAAVLLALFVAWEMRVAHPVMPMRLYRSRNFTLTNVIGIAFSLGMFGAVFLLVQYLQVAMGYSPLEAGVRTLPWTAAPMIVAPIAGLLAPRLGLRALLVTGMALQAGSLVWLGVLAGPVAPPYADFVPAMVMAGIGMGLTFAPSATAVLVDLGEPDHATASSVNSTLREVGVALGIAVLTAVFLARGGVLAPTGFGDALRMALFVGAGSVGLGVVAAVFLPGRGADHGATGREADTSAAR